MKTSLSIFKGLYGENNYIPIMDFIHYEPLEKRSKMYNWEIKEHLHNDLTQIFIVEKGEGMVISEKKELKINGPSVIVIPPNTLHGFSFQSNIKGGVFTISEAYLDSIFKPNPNIYFEINRFQILDFHLQKTSFDQILLLISMLEREINDNLLEKNQLIQHLFQSLFLCFYRESYQKNYENTVSNNRNIKYLLAFQKGLKVNFLNQRSISDYAKDLNITVVHLNRVCQTILGKSPIQIIHEMILAEAKKYLLNTSYSVSEIAYFLNFSDPAYFTRFFKKKLGVSPTEFRKN